MASVTYSYSDIVLEKMKEFDWSKVYEDVQRLPNRIRYEWHGPEKGMYVRVRVKTRNGRTSVNVLEIVSEQEYLLRKMKAGTKSKSKRVGTGS